MVCPGVRQRNPLGGTLESTPKFSKSFFDIRFGVREPVSTLDLVNFEDKPCQRLVTFVDPDLSTTPRDLDRLLMRSIDRAPARCFAASSFHGL